MSPERATYQRMELLPQAERVKQDGNAQRYWYELVRDMPLERGTALDVGAGNGYGVRILEAGGWQAAGVDLAPSVPLKAPVAKGDIASYRGGGVDLVTAMDVIEHVEDDAAFLAELLRVAGRWVFISTPNYDHSKLVNPFHAREYTWGELQALLRGQTYETWISHGTKVRRPNNDHAGAHSFGVLIEVP